MTTSPYRPRDEIAGRAFTLEAPTMPTMRLTMERLASGACTRRQRSTANRIFCCVDGSGETVAGDQRFGWQRGDAFSVPCWTRFEHAATTDAQLFSMSDEPLMRFLRFYRFEAD